MRTQLVARISIVLILIFILAFVGVNIFGKHHPEVVPIDVKPMRDSIIMLQKQIDQDKLKNAEYVKQIDSLNTLPPKIKIIYRAQKAIVPAASTVQLDSIIRANIR